MFTELELGYLRSQRLARLATVSSESQPDVAPVGYQFDGQRFFIGGFDITKTFKYKHVKAGNVKVALVVDDLAPGGGWKPRGVKVHGTAQIVDRDKGEGGAYLIITPTRSWSWGIEATAYGSDGVPQSRKTAHAS
jgi:pyridoxamine 5'-phosphate oxidase family protein